MINEELICLGVITAAHGIRGEVKVKSFTGSPRDIDSYGPLRDQSGSRSFVIKVTGRAQDDLRVKIEGCDDRNSAEALKGTSLYVQRNSLPVLEEEEFYQADLIGLAVKTTSGQLIGEVAALYNFGAGDLIEIKVNGKLEMLPFTKQYVPEIDIKNRYIIVQELSFTSEEAENAN